MLCLWLLQEPLNKHFQLVWLEERNDRINRKSSIGKPSSNNVSSNFTSLFDSWANESKWNFSISFFDHHFKVESKFCETIVQIGQDPPNQGDQDAYRICLDKRLAIKQGDCLVYSFGYNLMFFIILILKITI